MTEATGRNRPPASLRHRRKLTRASMVAERLWPLLLPALLVVLAFLAVAWFGLLRMLPDWGRVATVAALALGFLASLYPLRYFARPTSGEVDRRIEASNALLHTPVLVQHDRPSAASDEPFAQALWREHQRRMAARLADLRGDGLRTHVAERDPWGLRAVVVLAAVVAFAFSFGPLGGRLGDAFRVPAALETVPPRIDAWVTPPDYTGAAPIFLSDPSQAQAQNFTVPEKSVVSLRVTGGSGEEVLEIEDGQGLKPVAEKKVPEGAATAQNGALASKQFEGVLESDAALTLRDGSETIRSWRFAVKRDQAPEIHFTAEPKRAANGTLELAYEVKDDYGATGAKSEFVLSEEPDEDARPLYGEPEMPLGLPRRGAKAPTAKAARDLTEHVWAGSTVKLTLHATDAANQKGSSEAKEIVLPARVFGNPLARAIIEQRKMIGMDANAKPRALELMDAVTLRPEDTIDNPSDYLALVSARTRLQLAQTDDQLREVVDYLWAVANDIEQGNLSDAQKRLTKAQEALKQALENGASDEEIDKLMKELRQAMNEFLREFAQQAQKNPQMQQAMPDAQQIRPQDLDRMMKQMEELAKSGNRDAAQELLSQLQEMMNNLQMARPQQGQQGQQNNAMQEQMNKLGDIMRRQQEMMNETFRMQQGQQGEGQQGEQQQQGQNGEGQQPGQQGQGQQGRPGQNGRPMTQEEFAQALKNLQEGQNKLQQDLQALQKGMEGQGMQPGEGFGEAGREMGQAGQSLGEADGENAVGSQGRALEALRRGAQDMMQQMMQAMQGEEGGSEQGGRQQSSDRDPLGRPRATRGPDTGNSVRVPDEIDVQRARRILDAIRKRLGDALSPELERSYLERLLQMR
ncbi:MAG: TIGR02302 family protein [Methylobacterium mesophilicum]|nr:TIGR02302 family protein [Methylobacterium mesophilicum]